MVARKKAVYAAFNVPDQSGSFRTAPLVALVAMGTKTLQY